MTADLDQDKTEDAVLGGRLRLRQPRRGHRVGHDAILLAAATGARAGDHAVDLGSGVGGAGLALAVRVPGLTMTLVEIDAVLSALGACNARLNAMDDRVSAVTCDAEDIAALSAAGLGAGSVDRVLMNPPFNDAARQNVSPDPRRRLAHAAGPGLLARWTASAAILLKPHGVLTLIWRADALGDVLAALRPGFGSVAVMPVLPRTGAAAIRVLVRAERAGQGAMRDYPALVLNDATRKPSAEAEAVLRGGEMLVMAET
ncbi:MAG: methyltransferase [Pseudolabrys sp.]|nr:methyltransferase [Pseudolabrys sp.]MDP2295841.1 methyltransferase [Pseudolabrys sp.]